MGASAFASGFRGSSTFSSTFCAGGTTGSILGDVVNEGALVFDRSDQIIFDGVISGSGSLTKTAAGGANSALLLRGDNTYTGVTTIEGGTFQVTNTGAKPHDFSVAQLKDKPLPAYFQCVAQSFGAGTSIDDCPGVLQGGVTTMQPGESAYVTMVFGPGEYGYVSTQGDGADFKAGLNGTFTAP